jgi:RNA polymerase sigma-70 factor (ECF subfamily)
MAITGGQQVAAWVKRAGNGDGAAFECLVREFQDAVTAVVLAHLGHGPDIEDVAQEAFLVAFREISGLRDPAKFGPWTCGIARRCALRWRRDRRRSAALPANLSARKNPAGTDCADGVMAALQRLPLRLREPLTLFYINGYRSQQVSHLLGIPPGTVRRRLHEARNHLREFMGKTMRDRIRQNAPKKGFARRVQKSFLVHKEPNSAVVISFDDPPYTKKRAKRQWSEMQELMSKGQYESLGTKDTPHGTLYLYRFVLSDDKNMRYGSYVPLGKPR